MTTAYKWFLSTWARRLSWSETAMVFSTSWNRVYRAVRYAVQWGVANENPQPFTAIGVDEIACRRGHRYLTVVYQIDAGCRRLLWVSRGRTEQALTSFLKCYESQIRVSFRQACNS